MRYVRAESLTNIIDPRKENLENHSSLQNTRKLEAENSMPRRVSLSHEKHCSLQDLDYIEDMLTYAVHKLEIHAQE